MNWPNRLLRAPAARAAPMKPREASGLVTTRPGAHSRRSASRWRGTAAAVIHTDAVIRGGIVTLMACC
jgi:hypothetical protein